MPKIIKVVKMGKYGYMDAIGKRGPTQAMLAHQIQNRIKNMDF